MLFNVHGVNNTFKSPCVVIDTLCPATTDDPTQVPPLGVTRLFKSTLVSTVLQ